jgi:methylthioribose-1-phosphate isomerase
LFYQKTYHYLSRRDILSQLVENLDTDCLICRFLETTEAMLQKDINDNKAIGRNGAATILATVKSDGPIRLLTHCNTGSLATAG